MRYANVLFAVVLAVSAAFVPADCAAVSGPSKDLGLLGAGEEARVIVKLKDQLDPKSVVRGIKGRKKGLRTRLLVNALKDKSGKTQKNVIRLLNVRKAVGRARDIKPLWIVNAVTVTATRDVIDELAAMPEVEAVYPEGVIYLEEPVLAAGPAEDNLSLVNAPAMWDLGFTGQGVVVAGLDSGVDYLHPDLAGSYRGGTNSWYDPYGQHSTPYDPPSYPVPRIPVGHGTMTMGIMVGGNASGTAIGVAPGAKWIAAKIFDDSGVASYSAIHLAFQWVLDPDGDPATDDTPDVVNNSWGEDVPGTCDLEFEPDIAVLRAAGILPVFAAGNSGPSGSTDISPANNAGAVSVGATDNFDNPQYFSSRGPSSCPGVGLFPLLSAPGSGIRSTYLTYGGLFPLSYFSDDGTSFSAPHVAGVAALVLSASPGQTVNQLEAALLGGAHDISPAGPDNTSGYGRVDALAAYNSALQQAPVVPALLGPDDGDVFLRAGPLPVFSWQADSAGGFEIQFSRFADFSRFRTFACTDEVAPFEFTPDRRVWRRIKRLGRRGRTVYWRVKGTATDGSEVVSEVRTFTVVRRLAVP